jgi:hypothetical protein
VSSHVVLYLRLVAVCSFCLDLAHYRHEHGSIAEAAGVPNSNSTFLIVQYSVDSPAQWTADARRGASLFASPLALLPTECWRYCPSRRTRYARMYRPWEDNNRDLRLRDALTPLAHLWRTSPQLAADYRSSETASDKLQRSSRGHLNMLGTAGIRPIELNPAHQFL